VAPPGFAGRDRVALSRPGVEGAQRDFAADEAHTNDAFRGQLPELVVSLKLDPGGVVVLDASGGSIQVVGSSRSTVRVVITAKRDIEDVVAVKALETGCVPPVANFKEIDPEFNGFTERLDYWISLIARLRPGVTSARAASEINVAYRVELAQDVPLLRQPKPDFLARFQAKKIILKPGEFGRGGVHDEAPIGRRLHGGALPS
jgi:hypothetical protein